MNKKHIEEIFGEEYSARMNLAPEPIPEQRRGSARPHCTITAELWLLAFLIVTIAIFVTTYLFIEGK